MALSSEDVLFVGKSRGVVSWYRTGMPSFYLGCDWAGMEGKPPHLRLVTSLKRGGHTPPRFDDYRIVVLQQPAGREWFHEIKRLQKKGIRVIYEVDDYLHGVRKIPSHRSKAAYSKKLLPDYELCMRGCDAMIVSTDWLAKEYRRFNPNVHVARNSIEGKRYRKFQVPARPYVNIGWAGGEGHLEAVRAWLPAIGRILDDYEHVRFLSMGLPVADMLKRPGQAVALPFIGIENFPAALTSFDIAIAPAGRGGFYAAKSDLRFLETGALGIPLVADPFVYKDVIDTKTGILADDANSAEAALRGLIESADWRQKIGSDARDYVLNNRSIETGIEQWEKIFVEVWDS